MSINENRTWNDPKHYGAQHLDSINEHGTAGVTVIAPNGDAVSVISSIHS